MLPKLCINTLKKNICKGSVHSHNALNIADPSSMQDT